MKFLLCGVGSIGERHIRNLLELGYEDIILYRKRNLPLRTIQKKFPTFDNLDDALALSPDVAIICNPTHLHLETSLICAENNCHLLIEKPISHTLENCEKLNEVINKNNLIGMVGYMMRYHPALLKIKEIINEEKLGKVLSFNSIWGEYLPDWHPWEDYRTTYAALKEMGGGPTLTLSHELDLAYWLFGKTKNVKGNRGFDSDLELTTEHSNDIELEFLDHPIKGTVHLDYIQKPPKRGLDIAFEDGSLSFDFYKNELKILKGNEEEVIEYNDFERNELFISELKDFISAIKDNKPSPISISEGIDVLKIALDALD